MLVLLSLLPQALADQEEQSRAEEECHSDQRACPTRTAGCSKPRCGVLPGCCEEGAGAGVRRRAMQQVRRSIPLIHEPRPSALQVPFCTPATASTPSPYGQAWRCYTVQHATSQKVK